LSTFQDITFQVPILGFPSSVFSDFRVLDPPGDTRVAEILETKIFTHSFLFQCLYISLYFSVIKSLMTLWLAYRSLLMSHLLLSF